MKRLTEVYDIEHPEWEDYTMDSVNAKFKKTDDFDDKKGSKNFKIEFPYIFTTFFGKEQEADFIEPFHNDFAIVKMNNLYSFIDKNGKQITPEWFSRVDDFENERAVVCKFDSKLYNYIKPDGSFLLPTDVKRASSFMNGEAMVIYNGEMFHIDTNGEIIAE